MTADVTRLQKAIRELHGLRATHLRSERVIETSQGQATGERTVEVFTVHGHPRACFAYAWSLEGDRGDREPVAMLDLPPIHSPLDALRAAAAAADARTGSVSATGEREEARAIARKSR